MFNSFIQTLDLKHMKDATTSGQLNSLFGYMFREMCRGFQGCLRLFRVVCGRNVGGFKRLLFPTTKNIQHHLPRHVVRDMLTQFQTYRPQNVNMYIKYSVMIIIIIIGGWGGETAAAPTGKSFRFVRACERAGARAARDQITYGYLEVFTKPSFLLSPRPLCFHFFDQKMLKRQPTNVFCSVSDVFT